MTCNLCSGTSYIFCEINNAKYYKCSKCSSIFMHPNDFQDYEEEKRRYQEHNNDVNDVRYQNFVSDIVIKVKKEWKTGDKGLDFGAGTGPVITKLLKDDGYDIEIYDPFFWDKEKNLHKKYDYIVACEVIEHFHNPLKEFKLLYSLLKEGGKLYCKTHMYSEDIDFENWYYKNDPTHVFFYHKNALSWIVKNISFKDYNIDDRLIVLTK